MPSRVNATQGACNFCEISQLLSPAKIMHQEAIDWQPGYVEKRNKCDAERSKSRFRVSASGNRNIRKVTASARTFLPTSTAGLLDGTLAPISVGGNAMAKYELYSARKDDPEYELDAFAPKKQVSGDSIVAAFEDEIRKFIRRDELPVDRKGSQALKAGDLAADRLRTQMSSVSNDAMGSIDRVISDLQEVRLMLRRERERLEREIDDYANLSQAAQNALHAIAESLAILKNSPGNFERPAAE
jgi:hypothetical protein